MKTLVMKFGGTSVANLDRIRNVALHVKREVEAGYHVAVVVSAMSKVTDGLLSIASAAGAGKTDDALAQVAALRERHHKTAAALAPDAAKGDLGTQIDAQFDELARRLLEDPAPPPELRLESHVR